MPDLTTFDAILFDLDGVLTPTADVHMHAWSQLFTNYFAEKNIASTYSDEDYFVYLDGKPRYDGVKSLLDSRGITLPWGDPSDPGTFETVCGLGNRKNDVFAQVLRDEGVTPFPGSVRLLDLVQRAGIKVAVVSSSKNAVPVLTAAGLRNRFEVIIDGVVAETEGLPGKPNPDMFQRAADLLGVTAAGSVVIEDAISGVAAGRAGNFGLVVGVDRGVSDEDLLEAGADILVADLDELVGPSSTQPQVAAPYSTITPQTEGEHQ